MTCATASKSFNLGGTVLSAPGKSCNVSNVSCIQMCVFFAILFITVTATDLWPLPTDFARQQAALKCSSAKFSCLLLAVCPCHLCGTVSATSSAYFCNSLHSFTTNHLSSSWASLYQSKHLEAPWLATMCSPTREKDWNFTCRQVTKTYAGLECSVAGSTERWYLTLLLLCSSFGITANVNL